MSDRKRRAASNSVIANDQPSSKRKLIGDIDIEERESLGLIVKKEEEGDTTSNTVVLKPTEGWTIDSFPKPTQGYILIVYVEGFVGSRRFMVPVEAIDGAQWEVLIAIDGEEFCSGILHNFEDMIKDGVSVDKPDLLRKVSTSNMIDPGYSTFECFKDYKLPIGARPTNLHLVAAIITVHVYHNDNF